MSISNYAELKSAIADFLNRTDLDAVIPTFISLAEATFNRELRTAPQIRMSTLTLSNGFAELPADYLEIERLEPELQYVSPELYSDKATKTFTVLGDRLYASGNPEVAMTYYGRIAGLSDSNPSNTLLVQHPDLYLYGALTHSAPYLKEDARAQLWSALASTAIERIRIADEDRRFAGTTLKMISSRSFG